MLGHRVALATAVLVGLCAVFMEMNYLEPESFVFLSGLAAYYLLLDNYQKPTFSTSCLVGISLGIGFCFKAVAVFYVTGAITFVALSVLKKELTVSRAVVLVGGMCTGFVLMIGATCAYYAFTGRAYDYWMWTVRFPLFYYSPTTVWLKVLYIKLLWFHILLIFSFIVIALDFHLRRSIWDNEHVRLALCLAAFSYLSLLKQQSSHYCFPGAGFFSIFIVCTLGGTPFGTKVSALRTQRLVAGMILVILACLLSTAFHKPDSLKRVVEWRTFEEEKSLSSYIHRYCPAGSRALFVNYDAHFLYWISSTKPAGRFPNLNVQGTYFVERYPDALITLASDIGVKIVEFDPALPFEMRYRKRDDPALVGDENGRRLLAEFGRELARNHRLIADSPSSYHFWVWHTAPP
jgi:hypothetical protein